MKITLAFKKDLKEDADLSVKVVSKLIQWWTKSDYFHIEVIKDDFWISSSVKTGTTKVKLENLRENYDYYDLEVPDLTEEQKKIFWQFIEDQKNTGYDWTGIFLSQIFFFDIESKNKWFCSEIATKILQLLYVYKVLDIKENRVSPARLYNILKEDLIKKEIN